jgi:hypothetical protein
MAKQDEDQSITPQPDLKIIVANLREQLGNDAQLVQQAFADMAENERQQFQQAFDGILRSRHNPKILWIDDAEIVRDRITEVRPIPGNYFTQETERRIGELGASCVALVVRDVSVHEAP